MYMTSGFHHSVRVEFTLKPTVIRCLLHLLPLIGPAHGIFHVMSDWLHENGEGGGLGQKTSLVKIEYIFWLVIHSHTQLFLARLVLLTPHRMYRLSCSRHAHFGHTGHAFSCSTAATWGNPWNPPSQLARLGVLPFPSLLRLRRWESLPWLVTKKIGLWMIRFYASMHTPT